jgi:Cu2+-exporting ATPase
VEQRDADNLSSQRRILSALEGFNALVQTDASGVHTLKVYVDGIHCVGCISIVESTVQALGESIEARLNVTSSILSMKWQGNATFAQEAAQALQEQGYSVRPVMLESENTELKFLILCMGVAGFAMGNVMLISVGLWITDAETMGESMRLFLHWVSALIAVPTLLFSGRPFYMSALKAISHGRTNMDIPITVGLFLTVTMSFFETLTHGEHVYFDSAVMLMFFLLVGRVLDMKTKSSANESARNLQTLLDGFARVVEKGKVKSIPLTQVKKGATLRVPMGERFPLDGTLLSDAIGVDTSIITGESLPVSFKADEKVYGGMLNLGDSVEITVTHTHDEGALHRMAELVSSSSTVRSRYTRLADKVSRAYTPVVHFLALLAFVFWVGVGLPWQQALLISITVLIITCPCALGLSVPVVHVRAIGQLMKKGIFMKQGDALERLAHIDTILFDKTGTLTMPRLSTTLCDNVLSLLASVASHSRHPLSGAIVRAYTGELQIVKNISETAGHGVEGTVNGKVIKLGSASFVGAKKSASGMWTKIGNDEAFPLTFDEGLLPNVKMQIQILKGKGYDVVLLTGDYKKAAEKIGKELCINAVYSQQKPADKMKVLESYQNDNKQVLMVGDGLNDAAVLTHAHASLTPASASDLARTQADGVYVSEGIAAVAETLRIARRSQKLIRGNIILSVLYNVVAVPIAFAGFITPLIAAVSMSASSLVVTLNALRLK